MTMNKYVGSRYVPLYLGTHDKTKAYEPLSIVSNEEKTKTYTSIKSVPKNIALDNTEYWAQSGYFQDGIVEIVPDIAELASFEQPKMTVTKTDDDAEIKLEVADAYNAGASYGSAYVLNTLTTTGLYIIKPSVCVEVPDAIASSDTPTSLSVVAYDNNGTMNYIQQINSSDSIYMRTGDGETWGKWNTTSNWIDITNSVTISGTMDTAKTKVYQNMLSKVFVVSYNFTDTTTYSGTGVYTQQPLIQVENLPYSILGNTKYYYTDDFSIDSNKYNYYVKHCVLIGENSVSFGQWCEVVKAPDTGVLCEGYITIPYLES